MVRFILVRHGQSLANVNSVFAGHYDVDLSELGHIQAEKASEYIRNNFAVDKIYSSDLKRAYHTAEHIADKFGLTVVKDSNLREIYAGCWEGKPTTELEQYYAEDFGLWRRDIGNVVCTGGESVKELYMRISRTLKEIAVQNDGKTIVIATHATPIRSIVCCWSGKTFDEMKDIGWNSNASVTVLDYSDSGIDFKVIGEDSYLGDSKSTLSSKF